MRSAAPSSSTGSAKSATAPMRTSDTAPAVDHSYCSQEARDESQWRGVNSGASESLDESVDSVHAAFLKTSSGHRHRGVQKPFEPAHGCKAGDYPEDAIPF